jgi:cell division protein FtsB
MNSMRQSGMSSTELEKIRTETAKLKAEIQKLKAEAGKMTRETFWYPLAIASGLVAAVATVTALVIKLLGSV